MIGKVLTNEQNDAGKDFGLAISSELILLIVLVGLSTLFRLIQLGNVPMSPVESPDALAAMRSLSSQAEPTALAADGVMVFWSQRLAFAFLGGTELASRLGTVFAGVLLGVSPYLFRDLFGRVRTFIISVLLTFSPILFAASRFSADSVWAMLFVIISLWAFGQYIRSGSEIRLWAMFGIVALGMSLLLAGPGGPVLVIAVLLAALLMSVLYPLIAPAETDMPGDEFLVDARRWVEQLPWVSGIAMSGMVVAIMATGFLIYPAGLSVIGESLNGFLNGWTEPAHPFDPLFFPIVTSVFYDPWLWLLAAGSITVMFRRNDLNMTDQFLMSWAVTSAVLSIIYRGGVAADGLWTVVPLAGLASYLVADAFDREPDFVWYDDDSDDAPFLPSTIKWIGAVVGLGLLLMIAIHFQMVARGILLIESGSPFELLSRFGQQAFARYLNSLVWLIVATMLLGVGFFLLASTWGRRLPGRSLVVAITMFALLSNFGSGWRMAVRDADNPVEPWHTIAVADDANTLRKVMGDLAFRVSKGEPGIPVAAMVEEDSVVAWLLRDYVNMRLIGRVEEARLEPVVLLPIGTGETPDLSSSYVGQRIRITETWTSGVLKGFDGLAWWSSLETRTNANPIPYETYVLWVRQDIYDGDGFEEGAG